MVNQDLYEMTITLSFVPSGQCGKVGEVGSERKKIFQVATEYYCLVVPHHKIFLSCLLRCIYLQLI